MTEYNDRVGHRTVTDSSIEQFACLTGDFARAHLDRHFAQSLGFETNFAHGLLAAAWAVGMHARHYPRDLHSGGCALIPTTMEINFKQPVFSGDTLSLQWSEGEFVLRNQRDEAPCEGKIQFAPADAAGRPAVSPQLAPSRFTAEAERCYYAEDVFSDGPRGYTDWQTISEGEALAFTHFCGDSNLLYRDRRDGRPITTPPLLLFCQQFSAWLQAFTTVQTPASGFPGHLSDRWTLHQPVRVGDSLRSAYQCTALRPSRSRSDMGLLTITLQTSNQAGQRVMSSEIVMMMPLRDPQQTARGTTL